MDENRDKAEFLHQLNLHQEQLQLLQRRDSVKSMIINLIYETLKDILLEDTSLTSTNTATSSQDRPYWHLPKIGPVEREVAEKTTALKSKIKHLIYYLVPSDPNSSINGTLDNLLSDLSAETRHMIAKDIVDGLSWAAKSPNQSIASQARMCLGLIKPSGVSVVRTPTLPPTTARENDITTRGPTYEAIIQQQKYDKVRAALLSDDEQKVLDQRAHISKGSLIQSQLIDLLNIVVRRVTESTSTAQLDDKLRRDLVLVANHLGLTLTDQNLCEIYRSLLSLLLDPNQGYATRSAVISVGSAVVEVRRGEFDSIDGFDKLKYLRTALACLAHVGTTAGDDAVKILVTEALSNFSASEAVPVLQALEDSDQSDRAVVRWTAHRAIAIFDRHNGLEKAQLNRKELLSPYSSLGSNLSDVRRQFLSQVYDSILQILFFDFNEPRIPEEIHTAVFQLSKITLKIGSGEGTLPRLDDQTKEILCGDIESALLYTFITARLGIAESIKDNSNILNITADGLRRLSGERTRKEFNLMPTLGADTHREILAQISAGSDLAPSSTSDPSNLTAGRPPSSRPSRPPLRVTNRH